MDSIGAGNFREQARRELQTYEARLNALAAERDRRANEAIAAQERFSSALAQISAMQSELLASETRARELETGLEVVQGTLRRAMSEREAAAREVARLAAAIDTGSAARPGATPGGDGDPTVEVLTSALADAALQRDKTRAEAREALRELDEMAYEMRLVNERNSEIFSRLEDAMTISVEPLEKMFRKAGVDPDQLLDTVRRGYSGQGGPLTPISLSTRGNAPSPEATRAGRIMARLDDLGLYRLAADKVPLALPVKGRFRYTSGFGMRWGRLHAGTDLAGAHGTPIHATADGVVTHAGWLSGYGQLVKIEHALGIETRYAHMSRIRVREGQRVSRGDRIGDMGNTGRSTGTHLHYEVRVDGKAINPMTYIKAARDVF
jgi:murein DD-endopeptidase MepM/ murein hydrolase activator NlpD